MTWHGLTQSYDDSLNKHQCGEEKPVKKDLIWDLLMIISDKVMVKFKVGDDKYETETGRWCNVCK